MTGRTRAAVFHGSGTPFELVSLPLGEPGPGEVCVAVHLCTLCGSDLHTVRGDRPAPVPVVLGHEAVGEVLATGGEVQDLEGHRLVPGDRVTWSIGTSCGTCVRCRAGLEPKCEHLRKLGHESCLPDRAPTGALAEAMHLPANTAVVRVPARVPDAAAAQAGCATATVVAALRRAGRARTVLVLGGGLLGLTAAAMARTAGLDVLVLDPLPERRELALRFGAQQALDPGDRQRVEHAVRQSSGGAGVDLVLEMSGASEAVELGCELLTIGGRLVLVGSVSPAPAARLDPERIVRRMLRIEGVHNYRPADLGQAVDFLARGEWPLEELVSAEFPLEQVDAAFEAAQLPSALRIGVRPRRA